MACKNCEELRSSKDSLRWQLAEEKKRADLLLRALDAAHAKPSVSELLSTASTAAQIVVVLEKGLPVGVSAIDEAAEVALRALKQVRERLEEGAKDA